MCVGVLMLEIHLPGCASLKEKRSRLKPFLARLHREFNVSAAEVDQQDVWQSALVACALVSNDMAYTQRALQAVSQFVDTSWPDISLEGERIEVINI